MKAMKIEYEIIEKNDFEDSHRDVFSDMLSKQGKVKGNLKSKVDRCKLICIAKIDGKPVSIGAIKQKTQSDFSCDKAGIPKLSDDFEWELGYLYTDSDYGKRGIASAVTNMLIESHGKDNLMASTEVTANPAMVKILENHGFRLFGKPWESGIHENYLGLFLKFK